jgi:outer membrane protein assembly factor BamA
MYPDLGDKKIKFAGVPIPNYNDITGFGLGALVMGYYKLDRQDMVSPPSSTMLFGFYSSNETWVTGFGQQIYWKEDKFRGDFFFGYASVNFQFYAPNFGSGYNGQFIDYNTGNSFLALSGSVRSWKRLYLGLQYRYRNVLTTVNLEPEMPSRKAKYPGLGPIASYDSRENIFNPSRGWYLELETLFFGSSIGSDATFQKFDLPVNRYWSVCEDKILAAQVLGQVATGDVPFEEEYVMGVNNLRGYTDGKHRGQQIYSGQAEFRWQFWGRWGLVGFGGLGWVAAEAASDLRLDDTLPSIGFGARFLMIQDYRINARVDTAWGKNDHGWYFSIGEAF